MRLGVDIEHHGHCGAAERCLFEGRLQVPGRRLVGVYETRPATLGIAHMAPAASARSATRAQASWQCYQKQGGFGNLGANAPPGSSTHRSCTCFGSSPRMLTMPLGTAWPPPALGPGVNPGPKSIPPATTSAVYSPRLNPATTAQAIHRHGVVDTQRFETSGETGYIQRRLADAGTVEGIGRALKTDLGPDRNPRCSRPRHQAHAPGQIWASRNPMPTNWAP